MISFFFCFCFFFLNIYRINGDSWQLQMVGNSFLLALKVEIQTLLFRPPVTMLCEYNFAKVVIFFHVLFLLPIVDPISWHVSHVYAKYRSVGTDTVVLYDLNTILISPGHFSVNGITASFSEDKFTSLMQYISIRAIRSGWRQVPSWILMDIEPDEVCNVITHVKKR